MFIKKDSLVIRNAVSSDAAILGRWWRDGKVMAHAGFPSSLTITDEEIASKICKCSDQVFRILMMEVDNVPVGEMNYKDRGNGVAAIGIKICDFEKQEKGYGTRFLKMLISSLFDELGYAKIVLDTNLDNSRAQHVYEKKIGFRRLRVNHDSWKNQLGVLQSSVDYEITKEEFIAKCKSYWDAYIYDQQENETYDVELMLSILGQKPMNVLEVCCGTGRILVPLAKAGHNAVGFDRDEGMLAMIPPKIAGMPNVRYYKADALDCDWGAGYDTVVLAGNIMINIVTEGDYAQAQRLFIQKAAGAVKSGGHVYLDFDLSAHPESVFNRKTERVYFDGEDDTGVYGRYIGCGGTYDPETQMSYGKNRTELTLPNGKTHVFPKESAKHIPTLPRVHDWLAEAGFAVELEYGDYERNPVDATSYRAIIYAKRMK